MGISGRSPTWWEFREAGTDHIIAMFQAPHDPAKLGMVADRIGPMMTPQHEPRPSS